MGLEVKGCVNQLELFTFEGSLEERGQVSHCCSWDWRIAQTPIMLPRKRQNAGLQLCFKSFFSTDPSCEPLFGL